MGKNKDLQKMLAEFEKEFGHIKEWEIDRNNQLASISSEGGYASIDKLLKWQKENGHNIGELAKNKSDKWIENISKAMLDKEKFEQHKNNLSTSLNSYNKLLSPEERTEKYKNDSGERRGYKNRKRIYDALPNEFTGIQIKEVTLDLGYGDSSWKKIVKDDRFFIRIHKGTNQSNPSIYKKL